MGKGQEIIYLDNAASTRVSDEVFEYFDSFRKKLYANSSALHTSGIEADKNIKKSRETVAKIINANEDEIYFTSGGTECNNIAILGSAFANYRRGKHIITTDVEHSSVRNTAKYLEDEGYRVTKLKVSKDGNISLDELSESITDETILVSIMHVNNEIGTIYDIKAIGDVIKNKNENTLYHVDAVQSFCKYKMDTMNMKLDMITTSGHKIHSPKGVGALYVRKGTKINPLFFGGVHQGGGLRPGTENLEANMMFAKAASYMSDHHDDIERHLRTYKEQLASEIQRHISDVFINGPSIEDSASNILNVCFRGTKAQILVNALSEDGIMVGTGAACSSKNTVNRILHEIGLSDEDAAASLRLSFSKYNDLSEIDRIIKSLVNNVEKIRKLVKSK